MEIQAAIVLVLVFFLMLAMSVPVSFSIISASLLTIIMFLTPGFGMFVSAQKIVSGIDSFTLLAVPFFVLAGLLMSSGGIAKRLINLAMLFLGRVPGSLAMTNIAGNAMFGSISGSGIAAATAIGGVMLPLEEEQGIRQGLFSSREYRHCACGPADSPHCFLYRIFSCQRRRLCCGPSHGGLGAGTFVGSPVHGGGLRLRRKARICDETGQDDCGHHFKDHMGGYSQPVPHCHHHWRHPFRLFHTHRGFRRGSGVRLPLSVFVYKSIQIKDIPKILVDTAVMTTIVMLIIGASSVLSFVLSFTGLPQAISSLLLGISDNRIVILLIINITLLIVGTFMDMAPALLIFTPIFLPIVKSLGMDPIQFGVMIVMNLSIGTITPPVGNVLFVGCSVARLQVEDVMKKLLPFFIAIVAALMFITFVPGFSMWLPGVLGLLK